MIKVERLERPIYDGDWHDAPLRWKVAGPGSEVQNFSTKANAMRYASIRRRSPDFASASNAYVKAA